MSYERENIRRMSGYTPGEQPETDGVIKLNTNENPYPPAPKVEEVLSNFNVDQLRRYPPPTSKKFRELAARLHCIDPQNIVATRGGDELIRLAMTTYVDPLETIGMTDPTYSLYPVLAQIQNCPILKIRLTEDWTIPEDFAKQCNDASVKLTLIVNPHAPSGQLLDSKCIESLCEELDSVLLVDEAYVDFIDPDKNHNIVPLINKYENLIILRTLSKGYSLAGLRFGYGIGHQKVIQPILKKTRDSYNLDSISQQLAEAAIDDQAHAQKTWSTIRVERERVRISLEDMGFSVLPSQTNFLLARVSSKQKTKAAELYQALKEKRILVRYFDEETLKDKLRISMGTEQENSRLLETLKQLLASGH